MAAGVITIAHKSGGPKEDIIIGHQGRCTGFLADTDDEYAEYIAKVFSLSDAERLQVYTIDTGRVQFPLLATIHDVD
jgi:alpha-1,2-mannosyltransferase